MTKFETEIAVQPRDVDINGHVHHSIYLDYLLTARFDQMKRCYKMSMEDFMQMGFTWIARRYDIEFRTGITLGDTALIRTWVKTIGKVTVDISFQIESQKKDTMAAHGAARYVLIDFRTGKPVPIPKNVIEKYSI